MSLHVKDYLRSNSLARLEEEHGVKARFGALNDKVSLNYDQIKARSGDPLADQCRGLILRPLIPVFGEDSQDRVVGEVEVLAWPLNRFYNLGDAAAADVDWSDPGLRVLEKLDGTMCILYRDRIQECWHVATRSVPEADLPIAQGGIFHEDLTFAALFWRAWHETLGVETTPDLLDLDPNLTYVFELTTPLNRVVVRYDEFRITMLAARDIRTGHELDIDPLCIRLGIPRPATWASLSEPRNLVDFVNNADPAKLEGCVALDSQWRRVKVKNKAWVLSSKAKDLVTVSRRNALEAIINGSVDDIIPLVEDDIADRLCDMQARLATYVASVDANFIGLRDEAAGDRRKFALMVNALDEWPSPYFQLLDGKGNDTADWLRRQSSTGRLNPGALEMLLKMIGG